MSKAPMRRVHEIINRILAINNLLKIIRAKYPEEANQIQTELHLIEAELQQVGRLVAALANGSSPGNGNVI